MPAPSKSRSSFTVLGVALALIVLLILGLVPGGGSWAQGSWNYWISNGSSKVVKCPGNTAGSYVKFANADHKWVYIDGIGICKDAGANYTLDIKFLKVALNAARLEDVERDPLNFDWVGLAIYKEDPARQRIDWLYDEAKPLQGSLPKQLDKKLYFGGLQFVIPKNVADQATRFTLYLTAEGIPFVFGAL